MSKPKMLRRAWLRGLGTVAVSLPLLESLNLTGVPLKRVQAAPADWKFAIWCRQGNGVVGNRFWPTANGAVTAASLSGTALAELASHASVLMPVHGLKYTSYGNGCAHSGGGNQCLTAADVIGDGRSSLANGESVDNRIARELNPMDGAQRREPLTLYTGTRGNWLDEVLSYRGAQQLRQAENDPFTAYSRIVGLAGMDTSVVDAVRARRTSVNDLVREEMQNLLSRNLSTEDRRRLQMHFDAIRETEVSLSCSLGGMRPGELDALDSDDFGSNYVAISQGHADVLALAVACGYTKAATLQWGTGNDGTSHVIPGVNGGQRLPPYHQISHRIYSDGGEGEPIANAEALHHEIDKLHLRLFKYLLDRLAERTTPDGRLLDLGTAVYVNDLADGPGHGIDNVPFVFAGSMGGNLNAGQFVRAGSVTHNRLFNTVLNAMGVRKAGGAMVDDFGSSSLPRGQVDGIIADNAPAFSG